MSDVLNEYFKSLATRDRLSHAFLLCNTNYNLIKETLENILFDYFFDKDIDIDNCLDIYVVKPTNGKINKEEIIKLQEAFKVKSQINKNKVYIIDKVECMNDFASNSLLKFLEEPLENIYAFLISSNIDKVLPTIKSRCQILQISDTSDFNLENYDSEVVDKSIKLIESFLINQEKVISYFPTILEKKEDKEKIINIIAIMKYFFRDSINYLLFNKIEYFQNYDKILKLSCKNNNLKSLIDKLIILNKNENMLKYNLNLNMFLDKLFIEMRNSSYE